jgi:putative membrane protein
MCITTILAGCKPNTSGSKQVSKIMAVLRFTLIGVIFGIANVIPGVSGGTIAVVFGIYERLIALITFRIKHIFTEWKFWLPFAIGALAGIIGFSKVITILFERFPKQTAWFFIGIISGSIPMLYLRMLNPLANSSDLHTQKKVPRASSIIAAVASFALIVILSFLSPQDSRGIYTEFSPTLAALLFASGVLGAIAMIIPGISGSFFLVVIGTYTTVIAAVSNLNIALLIPTALGIAVGLFSGAALIRVLLKKAPFATYGAIFGLVAGSIPAIFPGMLFSSIAVFAASALCLALGAALSFFAGKKA